MAEIIKSGLVLTERVSGDITYGGMENNLFRSLKILDGVKQIEKHALWLRWNCKAYIDVLEIPDSLTNIPDKFGFRIGKILKGAAKEEIIVESLRPHADATSAGGFEIITTYDVPENIKKSDIFPLKSVKLPEGIKGIVLRGFFEPEIEKLEIDIPDSVQFISTSGVKEGQLEVLTPSTRDKINKIIEKQIVEKDTTFRFCEYDAETNFSRFFAPTEHLKEDIDIRELEEKAVEVIVRLERGEEPEWVYKEVQGINLGERGLYIQDIAKRKYIFVAAGEIVLRK